MEQSIGQAIRAAGAAGPDPLIGLWGRWEGTGARSTESAVLVAEALIEMARPEEALVILRSAGDGTRSRQLRALALSKTGAVDEAIQLLTTLRDQGLLDEETGGLLGGRYKERGLSNDNPADLRAAYEVYLETYEKSGGSYPGINAASLALTVGQKEESARIAAAVLEKVSLPPERMDLWKFATRGEAHLLLGDLPNARKWYGRAVGASPNAVQSIATMRRQARTNLGALALDPHALDDVLVVRTVAVFTGHMLDAPDRNPARFPASAEGPARLAIRERLKKLAVGFGFSSAARGGDVLFLEELFERGGRARIFLPFPYDRFRQTSVGPDWERRVDRVLKDPRATVVTLSDTVPDGGAMAAYEACNEAVAREAIQFAKRLGDEPALLAVWDGQAGDGRGGTADAIRAWQGTGYRIEVIAPLGVPREMEPKAPSDAPRGFVSVGRPFPDRPFEYRNRHCLCIGIREYRHRPWGPLPNARHDAEEVGRALADHHGFSDPVFLLDDEATAPGIAAAITDALRKRAGEDDLVLVFFAGHGHTRLMGGQEHGFIVPAGASGEEPAELVSVSQLTDWSAYLDSRHLLYVFDSCFSGMFQRMAGGDRMNPDVSRARLAITSGQANQAVYDGGAATAHSVFTDGLLKALREGVGGHREYTATELYSFLRRWVTERFPEQTPTLATLKNHEGGEILFQQRS